MRQALSIRIAESSLGIWQDDPNDPSFRSDIYAVLIRTMRDRRWSIHQDPDVRRNYPCLSPDQRLGARGSLRCAIEISGRVVKIEFWSTTAPQINPNGRRYDFHKLQRMSHIDMLRVELEFRQIIRWCSALAPLEVTRTDVHHLTPMQRIERQYAESWHKDKDLGRPTWSSDSQRKGADATPLEHGQTVWLPDGKGRILRGIAYCNINNMWWVIAGGRLFNEGSHSLLSSPPADLRTKRNHRLRRNRLEAELALAIKRMNFRRAETLKHLLFGGDQVFMIWARAHGAYYRSQYAGYTTDSISAGKYTRAEAEAECRRVPHELEMVGPDGVHTRFDRSAA